MKARICYGDARTCEDKYLFALLPRKDRRLKHFKRPVLVLSLDPASVEEMREKVAEAVGPYADTLDDLTKATDDVLHALGITPPQRKKPLGTNRTEK